MADPIHPTAETANGEHRLDSPIAPARGGGGGAWRWATGAITTATLLLAIGDAPAVQQWYDELSPSPLTEPMRAPIAWWSKQMRDTGLDTPRAWLRGHWQAARAARFGAEEPGDHGQGAGGD